MRMILITVAASLALTPAVARAQTTQAVTHGEAIELTAWQLLGEGLVDLFGSDGHRTARPATLDDAYRVVEARVGEGARTLFDGSALAGLAAGDGVDLAQGR